MSFDDGFRIRAIPFVQPLPGTSSMLISTPDGSGWIASGIVDNAISASVYVIETIETVGNIDGNGAPEDPVRLKDNISLTSVTASFNGDGNQVTNITASNITNFTNDVRTQLTGSQYVDYNKSTGVISLPLTGTTIGTTAVILGQTITGFTGLTSLSSSGLTGSGTSITNITASNIDNFTNDVRAQISGTQYVSYNKSTGVVSLPFTGSTIGTTAVILGQSTTVLTGLTSLSSSGLTGSGTSITNITASNITNFTNDVRAQFTAGQNINITTGTVSFSGTLPIANGGTGLTSAGASGSVLVSNGTSFVATSPQSVYQSIYRTVVGSEPNPSAGVAGIKKGDVVYTTNANGQFPGVRKAIATAEVSSYSVLGVAYEDIFNNTQGTIVTEGIIGGTAQNIDTQGMVQGAPLYLSSTTAGRFTDIRPTGSNFPVEIGICVAQSNTNGIVYVRPNYTRLSDLQNTILPNTQTSYKVSNGTTIPLSAFLGTVYLPIETQGGANVTLAAGSAFESPPNTSLYWGKQLWLHNIDNARSVTVVTASQSNTWLEGNVNLVMPSKSMVKFIWTKQGNGGTWVQTDKLIQAS